MNAIGTQLRDPIKSRLTRWRMAVVDKSVNTAEQLGRNPVRTRFSLSTDMSRLTRDRTAEPVSRDQILRRERGQDRQPYPVDPYSC